MWSSKNNNNNKPPRNIPIYIQIEPKAGAS